MILLLLTTLAVLAAVLAPIDLVSSWIDWAEVVTCWGLVMLLLSMQERRRAVEQRAGGHG
jgi:hypothetical protein